MIENYVDCYVECRQQNADSGRISGWGDGRTTDLIAILTKRLRYEKRSRDVFLIFFAFFNETLDFRLKVVYNNSMR